MTPDDDRPAAPHGRPMRPEDAFWLELDRPENLMVVTSLMWTSEEVDPDRLRAVVRERMVDRFPVFRQRPVLHGGPLRRGRWVEDPDFTLDRHLLVRPAPDGGDRRALAEFVGEQRGIPLEPQHPMWRMHLLQGYAGGSALVTRFHHSIADGIRSTEVMLGLLDPLDGEAPRFTARVGRVRPAHRATGPAAPVLTALNTGLALLTIGLWSNPRTALEGRPRAAKSAAWGDPVPLEVVAGIGRRTGTTVNDVCTALVAGALARYLARSPHGPRLSTGDDDVAWMVPVNLAAPAPQPPEQLGNHFALVLVPLPVGPRSFPDRLAVVHRRIRRIRDSWEPVLTLGLSDALTRSPALVGGAVTRWLGGKAVGVLTNVPGPRAPMSLAGAPVAGVVGWAPTSDRQALTVTVFSYAGSVTVGFGADCAVVPDVDALVAAFQEEVAEAVAGCADRP
ncbi:WS/DGAT domain-containing protein [Blastococcus sp. TF02A-30]|uniref:WS/DGAT domain-containing protein n=1 Tax=Blastococcus sp. TF02A-30 TaxID=2250580 RepID=UPI000DE85D31|nr:WS/DGAT domain-containing protein [Blastococcus sp. TF02A-30]RBY89570.1 hypothetical protein DQ241_09005 [Blastococcus sp. TF02A-30]